MQLPKMSSIPLTVRFLQTFLSLDMSTVDKNPQKFKLPIYFFCQRIPSLKQQVLSRYPAFIRKLEYSKCKEVNFMLAIIKDDPRSPTFKNIRFFETMCSDEVFQFASWRVKEMLPRITVPRSEVWRIRLLRSLLDIRGSRSFLQFNMTEEQTKAMIDSLCIT